MLKQLLLRLQSDSPEFFNKLMKYSVYFIVLIGIVAFLDWAEVISLPDKLQSVLWPLLTFFLGTGATSTLPVKSANDDVVGGGTRPEKPPKGKG